MIAGNIVTLRPIEKNDLTYLNAWKNDEETFKYLGGGFLPVSIDEQEKWLDNLINMSGNDKRFIICEKTNNKPIGMIGLYGINWIHRCCEIGIYIGEKSTKGKGYGKEACTLLEGFARNYLNLRKIKLSVVSENGVALNMWHSLGYQKAGLYKQERFIDGKYMDLVLMEKFL